MWAASSHRSNASPVSWLCAWQVVAEAALPPGVLNVLTGGPPESNTGQFLIDHPDLDGLSFTGSGPTGRFPDTLTRTRVRTHAARAHARTHAARAHARTRARTPCLLLCVARRREALLYVMAGGCGGISDSIASDHCWRVLAVICCTPVQTTCVARRSVRPNPIPIPIPRR